MESQDQVQYNQPPPQRRYATVPQQQYISPPQLQHTGPPTYGPPAQELYVTYPASPGAVTSQPVRVVAIPQTTGQVAAVSPQVETTSELTPEAQALVKTFDKAFNKVASGLGQLTSQIKDIGINQVEAQPRPQQNRNQGFQRRQGSQGTQQGNQQWRQPQRSQSQGTRPREGDAFPGKRDYCFYHRRFGNTAWLHTTPCTYWNDFPTANKENPFYQNPGN